MRYSLMSAIGASVLFSRLGLQTLDTVSCIYSLDGWCVWILGCSPVPQIEASLEALEIGTSVF